MRPSKILVYHKVDSRFEFGITRVTPNQFERHIAGIIDAGYTIVTLSTYLKYPERKDYVAITFDDAYESVYQNAFPVMEKYGAKSTLFVISGFVGHENRWDVNLGWLRFRHMNAKQLREMVEAGHEIGSHTSTHQNLVDINDSAVKIEMAESKQMLEELIGTRVHYVAFPFGRFDRRVVDLADAAGYKGGCIFSPYNHKSLETDPRIVYRQGVYLTDGVRAVLSKLRPGIGYKWHRLKQNVINTAAGGTIIVKTWSDKNNS